MIIDYVCFQTGRPACAVSVSQPKPQAVHYPASLNQAPMSSWNTPVAAKLAFNIQCASLDSGRKACFQRSVH
jgi:hypothetical protein